MRHHPLERDLAESLAQLAKAIARERVLDALPGGDGAGVLSGIPADAARALAGSPVQLAQAREASREQVGQVRAALSRLLGQGARWSESDWRQLDDVAQRFVEEPRSGDLDVAACRDAVSVYRELRTAGVDAVVSRFRAAFGDWIAARVRVLALSDARAGRGVRVSGDLPGDLIVIGTLEPGEIERRLRGESESLLRHESAVQRLSLDLPRRHPGAAAPCDALVAGMLAESTRAGDAASYRAQALATSIAAYREWRSIPADPPSSPLLYPFDFRGRCRRLQWWLAMIVLTIAGGLLWITLNLLVGALFSDAPPTVPGDVFGSRPPSPPPGSKGLAVAILIAFLALQLVLLVSALSFYVRRLRDAGFGLRWWLQTRALALVGIAAPLSGNEIVGAIGIAVAVGVLLADFVVTGFWPSRSPPSRNHAGLGPIPN